MRICLVYDCLYPLHGRRRRALVPQPLRAARRRRSRRHLSDAAPVGAGERAEVEGVRVVAVGPRMELYVGAAGAGSCRRSSSASASSRICSGTDGATTSCTRRRSRTSRCSRRRCAARGRFRLVSTGTSSGRATTGASTSGRVGGRSAGGSSACACGSPSTRSASPGSTQRRLREAG